MEASSVKGASGYVSLSRLTPAELMGCLAGVVLALSLFLPWFGTSDNPNSVLAGATGGDTVSAFDVFGILKWLLLAAASAPFILSWIVARGHKLTWKPGELTMVVGTTAFVLVLCNGIILGRPEDAATSSSIEISLQIGYLVALVASLVLAASGFLRQSRYTEGRKPPGVI
ncbi:MAG: hypothetical protein M3356_06685 [Actinomycetota bacterium]|nr:hypothetical protein [Actinomycetota bacterium]